MLIEAALLLLPTLVSAIYGESVLPFLITIGIILAIAIPAQLIKPRTRRIYAREGFVCVASSWILLSLFGALPFIFSGAIPNYIDALFETVSGFTTTGASILSEVESLPRGILFWRSFTHWIGGMGVLVFMLAILPDNSGNTMHLMRAEVPGPTKGKLVPKMRQTALILYGIYLFITLLETVILTIVGLPFYDAIVTAFATTGTGGFAVKNASIAAYANPLAEWVVSIFLFISGIN
jgi:trk system potassium uptake protein TrkH